MGKNKVLPLTIALVFFVTNASATPEKPDRNYQKPDPEVTQQLKLAQQFLSDRKWSRNKERIDGILQKLSLSAQQSRQAAAIRQKLQTERDNLYRQVKNHRQEMRNLLATNTSGDRLRQNYRETRSLLERLGNNHFEMMMQIRKILTPEQRVRLIDLIGQGRN